MIVLEGYCLNKMSNKELDEMMLKALGEKKTVQKKLQEDDTKKEIEFKRYEEFQEKFEKQEDDLHTKIRNESEMILMSDNL